MESSQAAAISDVAAIAPRIAISAFFVTEDVGRMLGEAQRDRRMARARLDVFSGGIDAAIERFSLAGSSNLVVVEWQGSDAELFARLERLAKECPHSTRVLVIGHRNDVGLYRALLARGVSDYAVAPVGVVEFFAIVARIYSDMGDTAIGSTVALIGASGGVGSSTVAHNVAWAMAAELDTDVLLVDADVAFGTTGLNFNLEAKHHGVLDALQQTGRMDEEMLERLVAKPHARLSVLSAPATLEAGYELDWSHFERAMDVARARAGYTLFDLPHSWNNGVRDLLKVVDQIVVVARPELAALRNCKNLLAYIASIRPNDPSPKLILNQVGVPRRAEIKPTEFARAAGRDLDVVLAFEPALFGTAANNGQLIGQFARNSRASHTFIQTASMLVNGSKPANRAQRKSRLGRRILGLKP
ncbi:AAA family ATPase [Pelagibacterium sp. H642]|uniref:AAA family ATPase n=1 Tax=Pelagibacterium sp. H642 TaxID=1881069 RepID=UPI00281591DC|nr:AAA family ATPase [Pelagibacterium sp. H642]WMT92869.1 AAA family ATPase [Pelagibacterium sp. H642]